MSSGYRLKGGAAVVAILAGAAGAGAALAPVAVSPGSRAGTAIGDPCPTFSWGRVEGARSYEVVVYRLGEQESEAPPVLAERIDGSALAWTPSLDRCLEHGRSYAWTVRAETGEGLSEWAAPILFEVVPLPAPAELAAALEVVRRHLAAGPAAIESLGMPAAGGSLEEAPPAASAAASAAPGLEPRAVTLAPSLGAKVTVGGEIRTIDAAGEARLWGRGRPDVAVWGKPFFSTSIACTNGSIKFGLSTIAVDWGSAADACPAGSWVCTVSDIVECDTERPDGSIDGFACNGSPLDHEAHAHSGWTAGDHPSEEVAGRIFVESGAIGIAETCNTLPVWCCWEV